MSYTELPDLPGITPEPELRSGSDRHKKTTRGLSSATVIASGFIVLILATAISATFTLLGKEQLMVWVGAKSEDSKPDKTTIAIQELSAQLQVFSRSLDEIKQKQTDLTSSVDTYAFEIDKTTVRLSNMERFASDLEKRIAEHKKAQQRQVAAQVNKVAQAKPKPAPIIPVVLISIRNQAGTPLVSLRDGLDKSELLMPGDSWRGWTLLDANPSSKIARFKVRDQVQELRL
jgi:regulator of replication initiation timing